MILSFYHLGNWQYELIIFQAKVIIGKLYGRDVWALMAVDCFYIHWQN